MKYIVLKKLNDNVYEKFYTCKTLEEAEKLRKIVKIFVGGEVFVSEQV